MSHLTLLELNNAVSEALEANFNDTYWVTAEVSEARVASNGHCYLEFIEKDELGMAVVARARANIWRNVYQAIAPRFRAATGTSLQPGISILAEVSVAFHPAYGYSLTIHNIDPTYTLGDIAKRRQEILQQLESNGILHNNQQLQLPRPLQRIAIISSATAAGYGDFVHQLQQSGHPFQCKLFSAIMQGEGVEDSCLKALDEIESDLTKWDCVVIIRGGGAAADLYGFERYDLAAAIATFPIPILTGIGHERDETVLDYVAHTRLKTPTAVAAFLIQQFDNEVALLRDIESRLFTAATQYITSQSHRLDTLIADLRYMVQKRLLGEAERLEHLHTSLRFLKEQRIQHERHKIELIERTLNLAHPDHILAMGYSITRLNGKVLTKDSKLSVGQTLTTTTKFGDIESCITDIKL